MVISASKLPTKNVQQYRKHIIANRSMALSITGNDESSSDDDDEHEAPSCRQVPKSTLKAVQDAAIKANLSARNFKEQVEQQGGQDSRNDTNDFIVQPIDDGYEPVEVAFNKSLSDIRRRHRFSQRMSMGPLSVREAPPSPAPDPNSSSCDEQQAPLVADENEFVPPDMFPGVPYRCVNKESTTLSAEGNVSAIRLKPPLLLDNSMSSISSASPGDSMHRPLPKYPASSSAPGGSPWLSSGWQTVEEGTLVVTPSTTARRTLSVIDAANNVVEKRAAEDISHARNRNSSHQQGRRPSSPTRTSRSSTSARAGELDRTLSSENFDEDGNVSPTHAANAGAKSLVRKASGSPRRRALTEDNGGVAANPARASESRSVAPGLPNGGSDRTHTSSFNSSGSRKVKRKRKDWQVLSAKEKRRKSSLKNSANGPASVPGKKPSGRKTSRRKSTIVAQQPSIVESPLVSTRISTGVQHGREPGTPRTLAKNKKSASKPSSRESPEDPRTASQPVDGETGVAATRQEAPTENADVFSTPRARRRADSVERAELPASRERPRKRAFEEKIADDRQTAPNKRRSLEPTSVVPTARKQLSLVKAKTNDDAPVHGDHDRAAANMTPSRLRTESVNQIPVGVDSERTATKERARDAVEKDEEMSPDVNQAPDKIQKADEGVDLADELEKRDGKRKLKRPASQKGALELVPEEPADLEVAFDIHGGVVPAHAVEAEAKSKVYGEASSKKKKATEKDDRSSPGSCDDAEAEEFRDIRPEDEDIAAVHLEEEDVTAAKALDKAQDVPDPLPMTKKKAKKSPVVQDPQVDKPRSNLKIINERLAKTIHRGSPRQEKAGEAIQIEDVNVCEQLEVEKQKKSQRTVGNRHVVNIEKYLESAEPAAEGSQSGRKKSVPNSGPCQDEEVLNEPLVKAKTVKDRSSVTVPHLGNAAAKLDLTAREAESQTGKKAKKRRKTVVALEPDDDKEPVVSAEQRKRMSEKRTVVDGQLGKAGQPGEKSDALGEEVIINKDAQKAKNSGIACKVSQDGKLPKGALKMRARKIAVVAAKAFMEEVKDEPFQALEEELFPDEEDDQGVDHLHDFETAWDDALSPVPLEKDKRTVLPTIPGNAEPKDGPTGAPEGDSAANEVEQGEISLHVLEAGCDKKHPGSEVPEKPKKMEGRKGPIVAVELVSAELEGRPAEAGDKKDDEQGRDRQHAFPTEPSEVCQTEVAEKSKKLKRRKTIVATKLLESERGDAEATKAPEEDEGANQEKDGSQDVLEPIEDQEVRASVPKNGLGRKTIVDTEPMSPVTEPGKTRMEEPASNGRQGAESEDAFEHAYEEEPPVVAVKKQKNITSRKSIAVEQLKNDKADHGALVVPGEASVARKKSKQAEEGSSRAASGHEHEAKDSRKKVISNPQPQKCAGRDEQVGGARQQEGNAASKALNEKKGRKRAYSWESDTEDEEPSEEYAQVKAKKAMEQEIEGPSETTGKDVIVPSSHSLSNMRKPTTDPELPGEEAGCVGERTFGNGHQTAAANVDRNVKKRKTVTFEDQVGADVQQKASQRIGSNGRKSKLNEEGGVGREEQAAVNVGGTESVADFEAVDDKLPDEVAVDEEEGAVGRERDEEDGVISPELGLNEEERLIDVPQKKKKAKITARTKSNGTEEPSTGRKEEGSQKKLKRTNVHVELQKGKAVAEPFGAPCDSVNPPEPAKKKKSRTTVVEEAAHLEAGSSCEAAKKREQKRKTMAADGETELAEDTSGGQDQAMRKQASEDGICSSPKSPAAQPVNNQRMEEVQVPEEVQIKLPEPAVKARSGSAFSAQHVVSMDMVTSDSGDVTGGPFDSTIPGLATGCTSDDLVEMEDVEDREEEMAGVQNRLSSERLTVDLASDDFPEPLPTPSPVSTKAPRKVDGNKTAGSRQTRVHSPDSASGSPRLRLSAASQRKRRRSLSRLQSSNTTISRKQQQKGRVSKAPPSEPSVEDKGFENEDDGEYDGWSDDDTEERPSISAYVLPSSGTEVSSDLSEISSEVDGDEDDDGGFTGTAAIIDEQESDDLNVAQRVERILETCPPELIGTRILLPDTEHPELRRSKRIRIVKGPLCAPPAFKVVRTGRLIESVIPNSDPVDRRYYEDQLARYWSSKATKKRRRTQAKKKAGRKRSPHPSFDCGIGASDEENDAHRQAAPPADPPWPTEERGLPIEDDRKLQLPFDTFVLKADTEHSRKRMRGEDDEFVICPTMIKRNPDKSLLAASGNIYVKPGAKSRLLKCPQNDVAVLTRGHGSPTVVLSKPDGDLCEDILTADLKIGDSVHVPPGIYYQILNKGPNIAVVHYCAFGFPAGAKAGTADADGGCGQQQAPPSAET